MSKIAEKLNGVIDSFEELRASYRNFINTGDGNRSSLMEYQGRFTDLKADLRPVHAEVSRQYTKRDDKSATAIKYRLAVAISNGNHEDFDSCSINQAEKYAPSSKEYKKFLEDRSFWKESLVNVSDLIDDISSYLIEIATRIKHL